MVSDGTKSYTNVVPANQYPGLEIEKAECGPCSEAEYIH